MTLPSVHCTYKTHGDTTHMAIDFKKLKSQSGKAGLDKISVELNKIASGEGRSADDRFWQPTVDKAGNGYAVIRFLPSPPNEDVPFVRIWNHGFKGPTGKWYIENSLTTIGQNDPVGEYNSKLWNSGLEADKEQARAQKRRLTYISNIYVVSDSGNPDNEGKVFLYKYGKKIFDKLNEAMNPEFDDEEPMNPFDLWEGANFKLKIRTVEKYRNYDKSEFAKAGPLLDDDDALEGVWKKEYSLQEFLDPKNFKSYAELKAKLDAVLDGASASPAASTTKPPFEEDAPRQKEAEPRLSKTASPKSFDDDEDEADSYFAKLADGE